MLMSFNTRLYLPEAARAASVSSCWHKPVETANQFGDAATLATRHMR